MIGAKRPGAGSTGWLDRFDAGGAAPEERARERHRRIAFATVAGVASRALTAVTLLAALPLASAHLSPQELGIWTLLVTSVALLGFMDLGLGNSLLNVLSEALGRDDRDGARRAVAAAWVGLSALALLGAVTAITLALVIDWSGVLRVDRAQVPELDWALLVFVSIVVLSIPAGIGQRIHMAYQQGWAAAVANGAGSVFALLGLAAAAQADAGLPWFVAAMLGGPALAYVVESAWLFARSSRDLRPHWGDVEAAMLGRLLRSGFLFFLLATAGAVAYQSDSLVIAHHLGAEAVTRYAVSFRLFMIAPSGIAAILMPLWPAYGEAIARRDHDWVRFTLRRSLLLSVLVTGASSCVMLVLARPLLAAWAPGTAAPSFGLLLSLASWAIVSTLSTALAMFLNAAKVMRFQVVASLVMASTNLGLSIALVGRLGAAGPVWASVITQTVIVLLPGLAVGRAMVRRQGKAVGPSPAPTNAGWS